MRILIAAAGLLLTAFQTPSPSLTPTPSPTPAPNASPTPSAHPPAPDPATLANAEHGNRQPDRNPDNSAADTRDDQPPPHARD